MRRYLIIGSGAAGISAAEAIRSQDSGGEITIVSNERQGYYSRPGLAYYLTKEIPESQLYPYQEIDFRQMNFRRLHARVTGIDPARHFVKIQNKVDAVLPYDRLLLAPGASAARMKAPGIDLAGVVKLDNLEDAHQLVSLSRKAHSAVVVGGGITALEIVEGLRARGVKVHYLLRGERYWSNVLDEIEAQIVEHRLKEEGVRIHYHTEVGEIVGKNGRVAGVITRSGDRISCQIVAIAIGVEPRKELAAASGLHTERGIVVNEYLQTSSPDIFAAGDAAQVFDPLTGKTILDTLWRPACQQGRTAGLNMSGVSTIYCKEAAFNVTRLAGLTTTIIGTVGRGSDPDLIGIARGDSETWRQLPDAITAQNNFEVNRLRILLGRRSLLGAVVMGDQTLSQPLQHLIIRQADISSIRDRLLDPKERLGDLVVEFWTNWRMRNAARHS